MRTPPPGTHSPPITHSIITAQLECGHSAIIVRKRNLPANRMPTARSNRRFTRQIIRTPFQCEECHRPTTVTSASVMAHSTSTRQTSKKTAPGHVQRAVPVHYRTLNTKNGASYSGVISSSDRATAITGEATTLPELDNLLADTLTRALKDSKLTINAPPPTWIAPLTIEIPQEAAKNLKIMSTTHDPREG